MNKTLWIILAAALLLGVVLFSCLRQEVPEQPSEPTLPSFARDPSSEITNGTGAQSISEPDDSVWPWDSGQTDPRLTETELPVDWNQTSTASPQNAGSDAESQTPHASSSAGNGGSLPADHDSENTEPGEAATSPEETQGTIVVPILPPDIFP